MSVFAADARKLDGLRDVCQPCRTAQLASARGNTGVLLQCSRGLCGVLRWLIVDSPAELRAIF